MTKASGTAWSVAAPNSQSTGTPLGNYNSTTFNALNYGNGTRPAPDLGRTYHFNPVVFNDLAVNTAYAMGKVAISCYIPDSIRAYVTNPGVNAQTGVTVTLTISGANSYSTTATIASIASSGTAYVAFAPFTPYATGQNLISVSVPSDDNNSNNVATYGFSVSDRFMAYTDTLQPAGQGQGTTIPNFWGAKYKISGTKMVTQVKAFILSTSNAVGDTVAGFVLDTVGNILGRSPNHIVVSGDLGTFLTFNITLPPVITSSSFIAGICGGAIVNGSVAPFNYYLGSYQLETPIRSNTPYYSTTSSTVNMTSAAPGVFFGTPGVFTAGRLMMECTVDPLPATDVGVYTSTPSNNSTVPTGVAISLRAIVKNYGTGFRSSGIPVKYSVNGGSAIGPVSTSVGLNQNDTTGVLFSGANALTFSTAGTYTVKIYTGLSGDQLTANDTLTLTFNAVAAIQITNTSPYRLANGIYSSWTPVNNAAGLWGQSTATQPNGVSSSAVLIMNNAVTNMAGADAKMRSPIFSFSGITRPTLHFYVANAPSTSSGKDDTLQVLVSTNGGSTYTVVYTKSSQLSSPTLGTVAAASSYSAPAGATDWRHEAVDLSAFAGNSYIVIAFRGMSAGGNNVFIDDIVVSNPASTSVQAVFTTTTYTSGIFTVNFPTAIGSSNGSISISRYNYAPYSSASPVFATNSTATTNSSSVFTPSNVSPDNWWTVAYSGIGTGNLPSTVPYYVQVNISGIGGMPHPDSLYIMKRSENNGSWTALSTTRGGTLLLAGPLYGFCDFGIGSQPSMNPLPVKWLDISAVKNGNDAIVSWSTASEINNDYFVVERSLNTYDFIPVGKVKASGNSTMLSSYSYADKTLPAGIKTIYYRIRQVDADGQSSTSKTVAVNLDEVIRPMSVYPNPFSKDIELQLNAGKTTDISIIVTDLSGRQVVTKTVHVDAAASSLKLTDLNSLDNGFYLMTVINGSETRTFKINKTE
jgi:hypothetical protein